MDSKDILTKILLYGGSLFPNSGFPVLLYHAISDDSWPNSVSPVDFEQQLKWLTSNYSPVSYAEFEAWYFDNKPLPKNPVMITFDDGYTDNLTQAAPLLQKYSIPATLFTVTKVTEQAKYLKNERPLLSHKQLRQLVKKYDWNLQSHTASHINVKKIDQTNAKSELLDSKNTIEKLSSQKVTSIAYPKGAYTREKIKIISEYYQLGWTAHPGFVQRNTPPYELPRVEVRNDTNFDSFRMHLTQAVNWIQWLKSVC